MLSYLYKITNHNKNCLEYLWSYIGFTKDPNKRWNTHKTKARCDSGYGIHHAMNKFGLDQFTFEILFESNQLDPNYVHLILEPFYIQTYNTFLGNGYNMTKGGGSRILQWTPEQREYQASLKRGKSQSLEANLKRSNTQCGIKHSAEHEANRIAAMKGKPKPTMKGENHPASKNQRKIYKIVYNDGREEIITGMAKFCRDNQHKDYKRMGLYNVINGKVNRYKDIISVKEIVSNLK